MKNRLIWAVMCVALVLALCACQKRDPNQRLGDDKKPLQGFHLTEEGRHYFVDGYAQSGWLELESARYFLGDKGVCTGWQDIEGCRYYFTEDGAMHTGWLELEGKSYLLGADGKALQGWQERNGQPCYLNSDGAVVTGWLSIEGERFLMNDQGVPLTGWQDIGEDRYYFDDDGTMHTGWLTYGEDKYYLLDDGRMAKGEVELDGRSWFFASSGKNVLVVNFRSPIPEDYDPELESWRTITLEKETMAALKAMILDGEAMGHKFWLNSALRTVAQQQNIWNNRYNRYISEGDSHEEALAKVSSSVARPGYSEHHTGLAVDVDGTWASLYWMADHSWEYGLIVRYPEGKSDYTGVIYEPWHFRFVGKELAKELYDLDLCVEEYMQMLTTQQGR